MEETVAAGLEGVAIADGTLHSGIYIPELYNEERSVDNQQMPRHKMVFL